ncbi:MAG: response regulator transcription factor [Oscillospiraceae bacterium]|nr:response regulator transcription factor [Oscillospiraceae bacterium]
MKLLYAEDERSLAEAVVDVLEYHKYKVDVVYDGQDALDYAENDQYDGIILDVMMPRKSGFEVLRALRSKGNRTPILLLTAKAEVEDRIQGLDLGADDYLPKPFVMGELLARIRAMLRRREEFTPDLLTMGNLSLDRQNYNLCVGENRILLPKLEFLMMELFLLNRGIWLSTEDILVKVWGYDTDAEIGIVWVYISYLRKKLTSLGANVAIKAKRGIGYMLELTP